MALRVGSECSFSGCDYSKSAGIGARTWPKRAGTAIGQYHPAVAGGSSHCRFAIADCRFILSPNVQSTIGNGNQETHPLPRGGTDLIRPLVAFWSGIVAVVLVELTIKRLAADAERACGVGLVAVGVIKRGFDRLPFNFIH